MTAQDAAGVSGRRPAGHRTAGKQAAVLASARRLFCERGVAATSIEAIAAAAQVSKQTVYTHFATKDALLEQVLREFVDTGTKAWRARHHDEPLIADADDLRAELRDLLGAVVHTLMNPDYLAIARVVIAEAARRPEAGALFRQSMADALLAAAWGVLDRVATELCGDLEPAVAARFVVGSVLPYVLLDGLLRSNGPRPPTPRQLDELARLLTAALTRS